MENNQKAIKLNTVFMGTSSLARVVLASLFEEKYNIVGIYTKPDKKTGRKNELTQSPVKSFALEHNIAVFQPIKFDDDAISELKRLKPDLIIVAAYGKIVPKAVLNMPGFGCINIHASLLPKFRGPSPIQNVLLCDEKETGITIMLMDEGIDTGAIISQEKISIKEDDNAYSLTEKLSLLSSALLIKTIPDWVERKIEAVPQNSSLATLCQLIEREDGKIYWEEEAQVIYNKYRGLYPWPGIFAFWKNEDTLQRIKLLKVSLQKQNSQTTYPVGYVFQLGDKIGVQTLNGIIILEELQIEGKKALPIAEFINGYPQFIGCTLL